MHLPGRRLVVNVRPLAIDLFCGLGGWTEGLLAAGYRVVGFDIERHVYGEAQYPAQLVIQDVLTLHGSQFKDAELIVASPPCQAYSYRAMPWKRAKALPPPSNELFEACFRIQREACEAAGRHIPLVVENVCGAQKWVGRARWHYGSFYLWGDVPALMPVVRGHAKVPGLNWSGSDKQGYKAKAFNSTAESRLKATKNDGGSWFAVAHNTTSGHRQNPDGRKVSGRMYQRDGHSHTRHLTNPDEHLNTIENAADGCKQRGSGAAWWRGEVGSKSSKSSKRKHASAHIAKIPTVLARHIAEAWLP
jgi:hypothetical protein